MGADIYVFQLRPTTMGRIILYIYIYIYIEHCCAHHQEVTIVLYSIWYRHTETSDWSKIIKIQFYKYEHIVGQGVGRIPYEFYTVAH